MTDSERRSGTPDPEYWVAPPRNGRDAYLGVWHPKEGDPTIPNPGHNMRSTYSFLPEGVQVKFTSGTRTDDIADSGQQIYPADREHGTGLPLMTVEHCDADNGWICKGLGDNVCDNEPHGACGYYGEKLRQYAGLWKVWWETPYGH